MGPCRSPNQVAEKVASRIAEGFSDTVLIMVSDPKADGKITEGGCLPRMSSPMVVCLCAQVDNTKFTMDCVMPTIHVYEHHESKWRCRDPH